MKLYRAIDLHPNNSVVGLIDEQDQVVYQKRLPNHLCTILDQLSAHQTSIQGIVVESTYNWYWLVDGLMGAGYRVHLANPATIQQYEGLKYTDDHSDTRWLAQMLRLDCCLRAISIQKSNERYVICYANAANWYVTEQPTC